MRSFTALEAKRNFGAFLQAADHCAAVTWRGRRRYVLMPAWAYDAFCVLWRENAMKRLAVSVDTALAKFDDGDDKAGLAILREHNALARRLIDKGEI